LPEIKNFKYHATTLGLAGHFTHPFNQTIRPQAAVALPELGGYVHESVKNFNFRDAIMFDRAVAIAAGSFCERDQAYDATAAVSIEGLNILNVVTADRIVSRVASSHPKDGSEPSINPIGSCFDNLRIAGYKVEVELATDTFTDFPTCASFTKALDDPDRKTEALSHLIGKVGDTYECSLVRSIKGLGREIEVNGNEIKIPGFGILRLGSFEIAARRRKVSMLQFELGSTPAGPGSAGGAEGNGSDG
jgi:hypothetical protein